MKRFSLFMMVAALVMTGCNTDDSFVQEKKLIELKADVNKYNFSDAALNEILDEYILRYDYSSDGNEQVVERVFDIAKSNIYFSSLSGSGYIFMDINCVDKALNYPSDYIEVLPLSIKAKQSLELFFSQELKTNDDVDIMLEGFANEIKNSNDIESGEKNIILFCVSLAGNTRKGKDDYWGNAHSVMAASLAGSLESPAQAVLNATVMTTLSL